MKNKVVSFFNLVGWVIHGQPDLIPPWIDIVREKDVVRIPRILLGYEVAPFIRNVKPSIPQFAGSPVAARLEDPPSGC